MKEGDLEKVLEEEIEWQNHQYDPGYWLGGRIPRYLLRKNKKLGVIFIIIGTLTVLGILAADLWSVDLSGSILPLIIGILTLAAGVQKVKQE